MDSIADHVITKCGAGSKALGVKRISVWLNRAPVRIYAWTYPRERGGTDGVVPARDQQPLLMAARAAGVDLIPDDYFCQPLPPLGTPANDVEPAQTVAPPAAPGNSNPPAE